MNRKQLEETITQRLRRSTELRAILALLIVTALRLRYAITHRPGFLLLGTIWVGPDRRSPAKYHWVGDRRQFRAFTPARHTPSAGIIAGLSGGVILLSALTLASTSSDWHILYIMPLFALASIIILVTHQVRLKTHKA